MKYFIRIFMLPICWTAWAAPAFAQYFEGDVWLPITADAALGEAWDMIKQKPIGNSCLISDDKAVTEPGGEGYINYRELSTRDQVDTDMALSVKGQAIYGAATYSARLELSRFLSIAEDKLSIRVRVVVPLDQHKLAPTETATWRLKEKYVVLARQDPRGFRDECGDGFIQVIQDGAILEGMLNFRDLKRTERSNLSAQISGSFPLGSATGNFSNTINSFYRSQNLQIQLQSIGQVRTLTEFTPDGFKAGVAKFGANVVRPGSPYQMQVKGYTGFILGAPKIIGSAVADASRINQEISRELDLIDILTDIIDNDKKYLFSGAHRRRIDWRSSKNDGGIPLDITPSNLSELRDQIQSDFLPALYRARDVCEQGNDVTCKFPSTVPLDYVIRTRLPVKLDSFPQDTRQQELVQRIGGEYKNMSEEYSMGHPDFCDRKDALWETAELPFYNSIDVWEAALVEERYQEWIYHPFLSRKDWHMPVPNFAELKSYKKIIDDAIMSKIKTITPYRTKTCADEKISLIGKRYVQGK